MPQAKPQWDLVGWPNQFLNGWTTACASGRTDGSGRRAKQPKTASEAKNRPAIFSLKARAWFWAVSLRGMAENQAGFSWHANFEVESSSFRRSDRRTHELSTFTWPLFANL